MRTLLLAVACVAFVGCTFGANTCDPGDCASGAICQDHFCVDKTSTGGGSGGGVTVGGGGGVTGGGGGVMTGGGGGTTGGGGGTTGGGGGVDRCAGVSCPTSYACAAATGVCVLGVTDLTITAPAANGLTNDAGLTMQATLSATLTGLPATLTVDGGAVAGFLTRIGQTANYTGLVPLAEGTNVLDVTAAFADAGITTRRTMILDTVPPSLTLIGSVGSTVMRDDLVTFQLGGSADLDGATTQVQLNGGPTGVTKRTVGCGAAGGCFDVDFSKIAMPGLTLAYTLTAMGADQAGNVTSGVTLASGTINRLRWQIQVTTDSVRAAPAIGADGTVYVGSTNTNTNGSIYAIGWDGGMQAPPLAVGAVQSVATATNSNGTQFVYAAYNNSLKGWVGASYGNLTTDASLNSPASGNAGTQTFSGIALVVKSATEIGAVATFNAAANPSSLVVYGTGSLPAALPGTGPNLNQLDVTGTVPFANNIVIDAAANKAYVLTRPGVGLHVQSINSINGTPTLGLDAVLATTGSASNASGQALVAGEALVSGSGALQSFYRYSSTTSLAIGDLMAPADNGVAAVATASLAYAGRDSDLVSFNPQMLGTGGVVIGSGVGIIRTSPVLGRNGLGYAITSVGHLVVFSQAGLPNSAVDWGTPFTAGSGVYAHPTLDCNRRAGAATATTGILYLANVSQLAAIIVDSPGLEPSALWPKYQRTAGNAGNTDTSFPLNPGCP